MSQRNFQCSYLKHKKIHIVFYKIREQDRAGPAWWFGTSEKWEAGGKGMGE
jgi:hypothetical protein